MAAKLARTHTTGIFRRHGTGCERTASLDYLRSGGAPADLMHPHERPFGG
jgi:hypothetical protein